MCLRAIKNKCTRGNRKALKSISLAFHSIKYPMSSKSLRNIRLYLVGKVLYFRKPDGFEYEPTVLLSLSPV